MLAPPGNGPVVLPGSTISTGHSSARSRVSRLDEEPSVNPNTRTREFSQRRDPDGHLRHHQCARRPQPKKRREHALAARAGSKPNQQVTGGTAASRLKRDPWWGARTTTRLVLVPRRLLVTPQMFAAS